MKRAARGFKRGAQAVARTIRTVEQGVLSEKFSYKSVSGGNGSRSKYASGSSALFTGIDENTPMRPDIEAATKYGTCN